LKKLFPRGHFKPLKNDEYVQNTKLYAQKEDETTAGAHVHVFHDPTDTIESVVKKVALRMMEDNRTWKGEDLHLSIKRCKAQKDLVIEDYRLAKIFVSATYEKMWREYEKEIFASLCAKKQDTHTHTHTEDVSQAYVPVVNNLDKYYNNASDDQEGKSEGDDSGEVSDGTGEDEDHEDSGSEADEGYSEGSGDWVDEEDAESEY